MSRYRDKNDYRRSPKKSRSPPRNSRYASRYRDEKRNGEREYEKKDSYISRRRSRSFSSERKKENTYDFEKDNNNPKFGDKSLDIPKNFNDNPQILNNNEISNVPNQSISNIENDLGSQINCKKIITTTKIPSAIQKRINIGKSLSIYLGGSWKLLNDSNIAENENNGEMLRINGYQDYIKSSDPR